MKTKSDTSSLSNPSDKTLWQSKVFPGLVMTKKMLDLLHYRYPSVKSWYILMLDLETYLVRRQDKVPKDFKKFVLNCAKRHAEDVRKGLRLPDGKVNLKAFENRAPDRPKRDESFTKKASAEDIAALKAKLETLDRGTPEYERTLKQFERAVNEKPLLSVGEILHRLSETNHQ